MITQREKGLVCNFLYILLTSSFVYHQRNGWPETTNTWEPPENLEYIPDIVEAFEERYFLSLHQIFTFFFGLY